MTKVNLPEILQHAQHHCELANQQLTEKRARIISVIAENTVPLSAYQISAGYMQTYQENMPVMSVYRILSVLQGIGVIHKLHSTNQYVLCHSIYHTQYCEHAPHPHVQFFICNNCHTTIETSLDSAILDFINKQAKELGFKLNMTPMEHIGLCAKCDTNNRAVSSKN